MKFYEQPLFVLIEKMEKKKKNNFQLILNKVANNKKIILSYAFWNQDFKYFSRNV